MRTGTFLFSMALALTVAAYSATLFTAAMRSATGHFAQTLEPTK